MNFKKIPKVIKNKKTGNFIIYLIKKIREYISKYFNLKI